MNILQRTYAGKYFLPKLTMESVEYDTGAETLFIATAWGDSMAGQFVIDILKERSGEISENTEVTRIGKYVDPVANEKASIARNLESLNLQVNKRFNDIEYTTSVDLLVFERKGNLVTWVQVGSPAIYFFNGQSLSPISQQPSAATQLNQRSPLANPGLGLSANFSSCSGTFRLAKTDSIVLISRDSIPALIFNPLYKGIEKWSEVLANSDLERPFWISTISI